MNEYEYFGNNCDLPGCNKLHIHFDDDKTKSIPFVTKIKIKTCEYLMYNMDLYKSSIVLKLNI